MKTSTLFLSIVFISLLFSSCSNLSNLTVSKRHYRGGFYVDFGSAKPAAGQLRNENTPVVSNAAGDASTAETTTAQVQNENTTASPAALPSPVKKEKYDGSQK